MMTETIDQPTDWQTAAARLLGEGVTVRSLADRTVAIGETVAHIRIWEPPATVERVTAIRALLARVPDGTGVPRPVGDPEAAVLMGGRVYDACSVIEGLPLNRHGVFRLPGRGPVEIPLHETADPGNVLIEAAKVLAVVHGATRDRPELDATGSTSAMQLHTAVQARWLVARKRLGAHAASLPEVRRWLRCGNRVIPIAADRLKAAGKVASASPVLIHNNIWPAYLLVDDPSTPRSLHGLAGWTSAMAGSPVLDLAQLSVRVSGWSAARVESILGTYSELTELPPAARRLVPVVASVDLLDQLAWLLEIAYLDDAIAHDPAQPFIRGGIKVLLRSLEQLTDVLAPPEPGTRRSGGRSSRAAGSQQTRGSQRATGDRSQTRSERRRRERG